MHSDACWDASLSCNGSTDHQPAGGASYGYGLGHDFLMSLLSFPEWSS